jgi:hypothetical protein
VIERRLDGLSSAASHKSPLRSTLGLVDDAVMLMFVVFLFPLVILVLGAPVALFVRALVELGLFIF